MLMKVVYITTFAVLASMVVNGQSLSPSVTATAGGSGSTPDVQVDWTIGEPVSTTLTVAEATLTQGFHQTTIDVITMDEPLPTEIGVSVFPNPATSQLVIGTQTTAQQSLSIRLTNLDGKIVRQTLANSSTTTLNVEDLPVGTYFLSVVDESSQLVNTYKIVKAE